MIDWPMSNSIVQMSPSPEDCHRLDLAVNVDRSDTSAGSRSRSEPMEQISVPFPPLILPWFATSLSGCFYIKQRSVIISALAFPREDGQIRSENCLFDVSGTLCVPIRLFCSPNPASRPHRVQQ